MYQYSLSLKTSNLLSFTTHLCSKLLYLYHRLLSAYFQKVLGFSVQIMVFLTYSAIQHRQYRSSEHQVHEALVNCIRLFNLIHY